MAKLSQLSIALPAVSNEPSKESSLVHAQKSVPYGQSWTNSSLFGTIKHSRRRYSTIKRRHLDEPGRREEREEIIARYLAPAWLINRAWSIQAIHASSGWTFSPRSYTIVPRNSIILQHLRDGNVEGIRELFGRREASPYDCDELGCSLLYVCTTTTIPYEVGLYETDRGIDCCILLQSSCM